MTEQSQAVLDFDLATVILVKFRLLSLAPTHREITLHPLGYGSTRSLPDFKEGITSLSTLAGIA